MAEQMDVVTVLRVNTVDSAKTVNDLKKNISELKKALSETTIGTTEYHAVLKELNVNQNALKDAMHATTASLDDVKKAAQGTSETYNGLVHRMAELKEKMRNVDISTEEGVQAFKGLARQINETNDKLKELDAMQGNYQRNVGNYPKLTLQMNEGFKSAAEAVGGPYAEAIGKADKAMQGLSKNPLMLTIGLLMGLIVPLIQKFKESESMTKAVNQASMSLKPVLDAINWVVEKLAGWIGNVIERMAEWVSSSKGSFKNIVAGFIGVGNSILQYLLAPIKTAIEAFKGLGQIARDIFSGEFKKVKEDAQAAFSAIGDAFKGGFAFKDNFQKGKEVAEQMFTGMTDTTTKQKAVEAGKEVGAAIAEGINEAIKEGIDWSAIDALIARNEALRDAERKAAEEDAKWWEEQTAENARILGETLDEELDLAGEYWKSDEILDLEARQKKKENQKRMLSDMQAYAGGVSNLLNAIADANEANGKESEKQAKRTKGIRIASATIDTIMGAVAAFTSAMESPGGIPGMIIGAVNAAAVTATGIASIAKMKSTDPTGGGGASAPSGISASVPAPNVSTEVQQTAIANTSSTDELLNKVADKTQVYILQSDIEASNNASKARVQESSF